MNEFENQLYGAFQRYEARDETMNTWYNDATTNFKTFSESSDLIDYETGDIIRKATADELRESIDAAKVDGGAGVIDVDGRSCYVSE